MVMAGTLCQWIGLPCHGRPKAATSPGTTRSNSKRKRRRFTGHSLPEVVPPGDRLIASPYWTPPTAVIGPGLLPVATLPPGTAVKAPVLPIAKVSTDLLVRTA